MDDPGHEESAPASEPPATLVAAIVKLTLDTCLPGTRDQRRAQVADELRSRLLRLLEDPMGQPPTLQPPTGQAPREQPSSGPEQAPATQPPQPASAAAAPPAELPTAVRAMGLVLDERLSRLGGPLGERADLRGLLIRLALACKEEQPEVPAASQDELGSLELLQRRASKLQGALRDARAALTHVAGLEHVDTGLTSLYREVQGLDPSDPKQVCKQGLLEQVFEANLALRRGH